MMDYQSVLTFWFEELTPKDWFTKSIDLDLSIKNKFLDLYRQVVNCECAHWRENSDGRLAEIIVIDQFSRNIYRDQSEAFRFDSMALVLAQEAIRVGADKNLENREKAFLYLPFMHSESLVIHDKAIELFSTPGLENNLSFEKEHQEIIKKFGRYPHRNKILGRKSTDEELEFLKKDQGF